LTFLSLLLLRLRLFLFFGIRKRNREELMT
jgi:hypothetical protein